MRMRELLRGQVIVKHVGTTPFPPSARRNEGDGADRKRKINGARMRIHEWGFGSSPIRWFRTALPFHRPDRFGSSVHPSPVVRSAKTCLSVWERNPLPSPLSPLPLSLPLRHATVWAGCPSPVPPLPSARSLPPPSRPGLVERRGGRRRGGGSPLLAHGVGWVHQREREGGREGERGSERD